MDRDLRIRVLFQALDKVTQPLRDIAGGSGRASQALREARQQLQSLNRTQGDIAAFRSLKQGLRDSERAMAEAEAKAAALARQLQAAEKPTKKLQAEFDRARRAVNGLKSEHQDQILKLQQLRAKLSAAGVSTANLADDERRLRLEAARANDALTEQAKRLDAVKQRSERLAAGREAFGRVQGMAGNTAIAGAASVGAGLAVAAPLAGASREAMTFESAMADVRKVVDFPTPAAFEAMANDVLDLSTRIPMAADGLAQIVAAAGRAGVAREELLAFAEDAAKMGVAFDTTAEDAGEMMAKWRTAFGLGQKDVVALADQINALTNTYGGNVQAVTEMVTRIGPLGKVAGVTGPQIAAIGQLMNKVGVEAEVGATGIKNMMLNLTKGASASKAQQEAFRSLGLGAEDVARSMQADASGTILDVMQRISDLDPDQQAATLSQLFGTESVAAIAPLLTNLDQLRENLRLVGDASRYAGSMEKEYLARIATTEGAVGLARNAFSALNITLGKQLLPTIVSFARRGGEVLNRLRAWAKENPRLVKGILWIAGILAGVLAVFGGLALAITALLAPFAALAFVAGVFNIAMLPLIGIVLGVVAVIAALAAGALYLYNNWDRIASWWRGLWNEIASGLNGGIGGIIATLVNFSPVGLLYAGFAKLMSWLGIDIPNRLSSVGANIIGGLWQGISSRAGKLMANLRALAEKIPEPIRKALGIHSPSRVFAELGGHTMAGLSQGLAKGEQEPLKRVSTLGRKLTDAMAVGTAATAGVAASLATPAAAATAQPAVTYNITVNAPAGSAAPDIARAVRAEIERLERERAARSRSAYRDSE